MRTPYRRMPPAVAPTPVEPVPEPKGPRRTFSINLRPLPPCENPHPDYPSKGVGSFKGDGGHRWGAARNLGRCYNAYDCQDCDVTMTVDSSD